MAFKKKKDCEIPSNWSNEKKRRNCHVQLKHHTMTDPKWVVLLPGVKEDQMMGWACFRSRAFWYFLRRREKRSRADVDVSLCWHEVIFVFVSAQTEHWLMVIRLYRLSSLCQFLYLLIPPDLPLHHIYNGVRSDPLDRADRGGNEVETKMTSDSKN